MNRGEPRGEPLALRHHEQLQFGHGGEPWRTGPRDEADVRHEGGFNSATAVNRGEPWRIAWLRSSSLSFNSATAVNRGEPRRSRPSSAGARCRFNSATAVNRGEPPTSVGTPVIVRALQFGHGGEPWRTTSTTRMVGSSSLRFTRFNSATAVNRGEPRPIPTRSRRRTRFNSATAVNRGEPSPRISPGSHSARLQFGHGGEPWRTPRQRELTLEPRSASIRPRR